MSENMTLWNAVCETDPATTKHVSQRGGFTAIDAQAQIKRATELWGPYGQGWVITDLAWGEIRDAAGEVKEITLDARFVAGEIAFPISSDHAWRPGDDSRKKLLTDVTTKALSKLGFNSDVFEGKFDDNKYVQEQKKKRTKKAKPDTQPDPPPEVDATLVNDLLGEITALMSANAYTADERATIKKTVDAIPGDHPQALQRLKKIRDHAKAELERRVAEKRANEDIPLTPAGADGETAVEESNIF